MVYVAKVPVLSANDRLALLVTLVHPRHSGVPSGANKKRAIVDKEPEVEVANTSLIS